MYFWNKTLDVSDSFPAHHQEFFTVHTAMVYVIQVCWLLASKLSTNLCVLLCVQWKTPDDVEGNCPKHVEFYSKNKFEKFAHLVGFIITTYNDARSPERFPLHYRKIIRSLIVVILGVGHVIYVRCKTVYRWCRQFAVVWAVCGWQEGGGWCVK